MVLDALLEIPRHQFVPPESASAAYEDGPLPIGHGQTISQPYIVALMTELLHPSPNERVLEIGTGCGYQTAVLARLFREVHTVEIVPELASEAQARLETLEFRNISYRIGDGYDGWPDAAPFEAILAAAAPDHVPQPLIEQLAPGGRLVIPVGDTAQDLVLVRKTPEGIVRETIIAVKFVPLVHSR